MRRNVKRPGICINAAKTKKLRLFLEVDQARQTQFLGFSLALVESFTYFGSVVDTQEGKVQDAIAPIN